MRTFGQGDVIRVPFPYTDHDTRQRRPALVVSRGGVGEKRSLLWVAMITSASNRRWPGDVSLGDDYRKVGLPIPSIVRTTKVATIEARHADPVGRLDASHWAKVGTAIRRQLGFEE